MAFELGWPLLFVLAGMVCIGLVQTAYPWTAILVIIASVLLYLYDQALILDATRPKWWRVDDSWPRKLWKVLVGTVVGTVLGAVIIWIFGEVLAVVFIVAFAAIVIAALIAFVAERLGWRPYWRLERHRPPLVDPRFRASRDPTETRPS